MINTGKKRLRRTMMFLNAQKPGLIKDPYIYRPDSIMLDLEDAVAENQKDAARFSLYHALKTIINRDNDRPESVQLSGLFYALICAYSLKNDSCMQFGYRKQKNMVFEFVYPGRYNITKG